MYNKLSLKIGCLFFIFILVIESFLFFILYSGLVNDRIEEVMENLLVRGETHTEVLVDDFESTTMEHVGIMESVSDYAVIITDETGDILVNSDPIDDDMLDIIGKTSFNDLSMESKIIEDRWMDQKYIAANTPVIVDGVHKGHVFMFADTIHVAKIIDQLNAQFLVVSIATILLTIVTIFILSRYITLPLIRIKEATEQLGKGHNRIELYTNRKDELGELAHSITKLSQDLDRLKNERNEFLASISHELRTPLTYIKGYADILDRKGIKENERDEYISIIREETEQLNVLIKNLLELAKMDQNNFVIQRENVRLCDLIKSISNLIRPALLEKDIMLSVSCSKEIIAFVDPERFQQVLLNIIDNARKHSEVGSQIILEVTETKSKLNIVISDSGEGIPEKDLPHIFERLYRVEKSRSRASGGKGFGLAIAKEIVESHGGEIEVHSELGKGTTITISLGSEHVNE
ncbi:HAMP domain-containing protein [Ornithinibacillus sp. L9]|uniref:histidine kinase n=1 Tax=Ornithinibacillus caprae TaxID=2678566 RepID=A0A6N8FID1_9BACI|nr:HAMP domain-containing sensor histidine kinase [Ornithinibacillus caprae]MUK89215.1 HAMP domain-containing protein [Ornithinibacillus caprae]